MKLRCDPYLALKLMHEAQMADETGIFPAHSIVYTLDAAIAEWDDCLQQLIEARRYMATLPPDLETGQDVRRDPEETH